MIGLDTNVLVRYIAQDHPQQTARATALIDAFTREHPGYITMICLAELVWVMKGCYGSTRQEIAAILNMLVRTEEIRVENIEIVIKAIKIFAASTADFSDCLIALSGNASGCHYTVTFDAGAIKGTGMRLVE